MEEERKRNDPLDESEPPLIYLMLPCRKCATRVDFFEYATLLPLIAQKGGILCQHCIEVQFIEFIKMGGLDEDDDED